MSDRKDTAVPRTRIVACGALAREVVETLRAFPGAPLDVTCLPVALNSGMCWPRRRFLRYPGTIVVEFLEPIPPGLPRKEFSALLQERIETASARLLEAG